MRVAERCQGVRAIQSERGRTRRVHEVFDSYILFTLPAVVMIGFITAYPAFYGFWMSFHQLTNVVGVHQYVGLANYRFVFGDPTFWKAIRVSVQYVSLSVALTVLLGLGIALLLNTVVRFKGIFIALYLVPWVITEVVAAEMYYVLLDSSFGIVNKMIVALGFSATRFLTTPNGALGAITVASVWRSVGFAMIIFIAALQTISREVIESASTDGAVGWKRFRYITFPMIRYHFLVVIILLTLTFMNQVALVYTMTRGGPANATLVGGVYLYKMAFSYFEVGRASALSVLFFLANVAVISVYIRLLRRPSLY